MKTMIRRICLVFLLSLIGLQISWAQDNDNYVQRLAGEFETVVTVNLVGSVGNTGGGSNQSSTRSGRFAVRKGMRLDEFIYIVGAINQLTEVEDRNTLAQADSQVVTIRVSRQQGNERIIIYEENTEAFLVGPIATPILEEEDTIIIDRIYIRGRDPLRTIGYITSGISAVTLLVSIINLLR